MLLKSKVNYKYLMTLRSVISVVLLVSSCADDKKSNSDNKLTEEPVEEKVFFEVVDDELVKNSKFSNWLTETQPDKWTINEKDKTPKKHVFDRDTLPLLLKGSKAVPVYIKQKLNLEQGLYYIAEVEIQTNLKSNSYAGLTILSDGEFIGKKVFEKKGSKAYSTVFKGDASNELEMAIY